MKGATVTNMQKVTEKLPGQAERLLRLEKRIILSVLKIPVLLRKGKLKSKSSIPECQCSCHDSSWVATVSAYT